MILRCMSCATSVSTEVPDDTVVRAALTCPECLEQEEPQWNIFDKDDESTWPQESDKYWIAVTGEGIKTDSWMQEPLWDWASWLSSLVTHWMPIAVPGPPKDIT